MLAKWIAHATVDLDPPGHKSIFHLMVNLSAKVLPWFKSAKTGVTEWLTIFGAVFHIAVDSTPLEISS